MTKRVLAIVILLLALSGCATTLHTIPTNFSLGGSEESIVIGHLIIDWGVKPIEFFDRHETMPLTVKNESSGKSYAIVCDEGGSDSRFFVVLPVGRYRISQLVKGRNEWGGWLNPLGHFEVGAGQVVYIGALKWVQSKLSTTIIAGVLTGGHFFPGSLFVEDTYEEDAYSFRERYPHIDQQIVKSIIKLE